MALSINRRLGRALLRVATYDDVVRNPHYVGDVPVDLIEFVLEDVLGELDPEG